MVRAHMIVGVIAGEDFIESDGAQVYLMGRIDKEFRGEGTSGEANVLPIRRSRPIGWEVPYDGRCVGPPCGGGNVER